MKRRTEVLIAVRLYTFACDAYTRPKPIPMIAAALACSPRKAGGLIATARGQGLLPPGRAGYVTKP
jgi:hypothetical protein